MIEKNGFKVAPSSKLEPEVSSRSSEEDEFGKPVRNSAAAEVELQEDGFDDCDSAAGSDDFDLLELGETGEEFCQIADQTCSIPFELYDLPGLEHILSMDVWNDVLTEEERFSLTKHLPDMDQEHFMRTLKDLFTGSNFHFGVPISKLFNMLKSGLCEPRVSLYRQSLAFFQKHHHYHTIRKHQNTMVNNLVRIHKAWSKCRGYSIDEKLRVLNITNSQKNLMYEKVEEFETGSSEESADGFRGHYPGYRSGPTFALEPTRFTKQNSKGSLKVSGSNPFPSLELKPGPSGSSSMYDVTIHREHNLGDKFGKRYKGFINEEFQEPLMGLPVPLMRAEMPNFGRNRIVNQLSDIQVLTAKPSNSRFHHYDYGRKFKRAEFNQINVEDVLKYRNPRDLNLSQVDNQQDPFWHQESFDPYRMGMKKGRIVNSQNGGRVVAAAEGMKMLAKGEETESDSSGQFEDDDNNPLMRSKWAYPSGVKSGPNSNKPKPGGKNSFFNDSNGAEAMFSRTHTGGNKRRNDYFTLPTMHVNDYVNDELVDVRLLGGDSGSKKRKVKEELMFLDDQDQENHGQGQSQSQLDDVYVRTLGKRKWADDSPFETTIPEPMVMEVAEEEDADLENRTRKKPFTLITPTVHTGFSFSIIHLLSAVRMAMVTLLPEDNVNDEVKHEVANDMNPNPNPNIPCLTVKEIVNRVQSNPGDPCILETQEPLQDLVRGVLKIFSSKTAPLGAKGWKPLAQYKKPVKSWSWVGPVSSTSSDHEMVEEVTSPDSWGLPHKMLVKLVDSFANWLKSGQETLQQIGSLPAPPSTLVNLDEKERFRDLRAQKSLNTINPSSDEVRDYFRKEEVLRYLIPDRAFAYTAVDGKKSTVAPSRKGAGKPTSKARDHFMLKRDRPPHVTILCLVRDAAARLPGSIGTRADVCTLIRDSQYIVEDVSDAQVNQVVSGALDRLHYERDPCVQFDGERKLWVYLHREREEEDFEDDGTSSTKKWKRQKKEPVEPPGEPTGEPSGAVTLAYHGTGGSPGFDLSVEPSGVNNELCQKNFADQDFDDGRDEDVDALNTSVS